MIGKLKSNWRLVLLVVAVVLSVVMLLPLGTSGDDPAAGEPANGLANGTAGDAEQRLTSLRYGIDLAGGTRVRAPLVGQTAEGVAIGDADISDVAADIASQLPDTTTTDVIVRGGNRPNTATVEMVDPDVSTESFEEALTAAGYDYDGIRDGVTQSTREEAEKVLKDKVNQAGLSGATVQQAGTGPTGFEFLIEAPGQDQESLIGLIRERGTVRIDVYHPNESGEYVTERAVITEDDFTRVGSAQESTRTGPHVDVAISENAAPRIQQQFVETGVAQRDNTRCTYEEQPNTTDPCLLLVSNGEVINDFGMDGDLGRSMISGEWAESRSFLLTTTSLSEAQQISLNLRAGSLPAKLDINAGTISSVSQSQGESFRTNSLIIAVLAMLTVSGVVFVRYRELDVAAPMIVTAFSEVVILLGFAAYFKYPLDLSVIASFIAVLGTGVDDLVIIADEVMAEGEVSSQRVFSSRFKKAFWVIGVAAGTTIIAMSPLAYLSLGELKGFAIFTILGVLVGVLITRPAYGDILRYLLTDR